MRAQVAALADAAAPNVDGAIEFGQPMTFVMQSLTSLVRNATPGAVDFTEIADALGLICWLFGDEVVAKLEREIDACADDASALSREQREMQEAQIMADMLAVERKECALIFAAEAQGSVIDFRPDTCGNDQHQMEGREAVDLFIRPPLAVCRG
jgi:hypothetical protein